MMKKWIISVIVILAMAVCVFPLAAFADYDTTANQLSSSPTLSNINKIKIRNPDNYNDVVTIYVNEDYIGFNHISSGLKVKACQAYTKACGAEPGTIDGYWGQNSESALRVAQQTLHDYGYSVITSDGVCGPNTWRGFYSYCGIPGSVRSAVFS